MTLRRPLIFDGSNGMIEMTESQLTAVSSRVLDLYAANNPVVLSYVGSGGNVGTINDTRKQAGESTSHVSSFRTKAQTPNISTVTVNYSRIQQTLATVSTPSNPLPVYWDNATGITEMTDADFADTFLAYPFGLLTSGSVGNNSAGTYFISTANSVADATKIGNVFVDTRANAGAYTAGGIGETQDQPTTIQTYRLHRRDTFGSVSAYETPFYIPGTIGIQRYTKPSWEAILIEQMRYHAVSTPGYRITYNFNGSGTASGSAITNTILNGSSNNGYNQHFENENDYRTQEFPNGTAVTANTYQFKILLS